MKPLWNSIGGGVVGATVTAFLAMFALSTVATDLDFGMFALWLLPSSALVGLFLGVKLQGSVDWERPRPKSLRHWFIGGAATAILLFLVYIIASIVSEGYKLADVEYRVFPVIVLPLIVCSFAGAVGGFVGLTVGAVVHWVRRDNDVGRTGWMR